MPVPDLVRIWDFGPGPKGLKRDTLEVRCAQKNGLRSGVFGIGLRGFQSFFGGPKALIKNRGTQAKLFLKLKT